jgi:hypothetical protein
MTAFARITADHDALAFAVSPCARLLYRFLLRLRPAGQAIEFEIEDFNQFAGNYRRRPFSEKWIKAAIAQLESIGLVQVLKQFNARCLKLVALHPESSIENKTSQDQNKTSFFKKKTSEKQPSNAYSLVPIHREYRENNEQSVVVLKNINDVKNSTDAELLALTNLEIVYESDRSIASVEKIFKTDHSLPNLDLVYEDDNSLASLEIASESQVFEINAPVEAIDSQEEEFSAPPKKNITNLLEKAEDAGVLLNPFVIGLIAKTEAEIVANAIAALRESRRKGTVKNPTGYLVKAIQQKWQPMEAKDPSSGYPHGFWDWYQKVVALGLVENVPANHLSRDRSGEPFVRLPIQDGSRPYLLKPWREAMVMFTD